MSLHHCDICKEPMHQLDSDNGSHYDCTTEEES